MYNKFDLHVYSKYSSFAINEPRDIVNNCVKKGIKGFAVTDLGTIRSWSFLHKLCLEKNLIFITGQEINLTYKNNSIGKSVALFTLDKINSTDIFEVLDEIKSQGALLSLTNIFDINKKTESLEVFKHKGPLNRKLRCVETYNSRTLFNTSNINAQEFAKENNLMQTAGSSAHLSPEIGNGYVICEANSESELLKAIKLRQTKVGGTLSGLKPRVYSLANKIFTKN